MIKAAIVIERTDIALGGAERSVSELAEALRFLGVNTTILAAKGDRGDDNNIKVLCNEWPGKRTPFRIFRAALFEHIQKNDYDIIHSTLPFEFADIYQPRGGSYKEAMIRNADSYHCSITRIVKKATHFLNRKRYELLKAEKALCRHSGKTVIAALSGYVKEQFAGHYGLDDTRVRVIANGIKCKDPVGRKETAPLRNQWLTQSDISISANPAVFLFGANNFRLKGLPCLIKAVKIINACSNLRDVCVVVTGNSDTEKYKKLAEKSGVSGNFLFAGSFADLHTAICAADVAVLPTFYDPCSRFILEAISVGKPVITTRYNGASERFENLVHGITISDGNCTDQLADAIKHFLKDSSIEDASRAIINDNLKNNISIEMHARQMIRLYKDILYPSGKTLS